MHNPLTKWKTDKRTHHSSQRPRERNREGLQNTPTFVKRYERNMGVADRLVRGLLGAYMLANGLRNTNGSGLRKVEAAVGGAFMLYSATGYDPLLCATGSTTIPGKENTVWNLIRQAIPGQGIKPSILEQVYPARPTRAYRENSTVREALTIG